MTPNETLYAICDRLDRRDLASPAELDFTRSALLSLMNACANEGHDASDPSSTCFICQALAEMATVYAIMEAS